MTSPLRSRRRKSKNNLYKRKTVKIKMIERKASMTVRRVLASIK